MQHATREPRCGVAAVTPAGTVAFQINAMVLMIQIQHSFRRSAGHSCRVLPPGKQAGKRCETGKQCCIPTDGSLPGLCATHATALWTGDVGRAGPNSGSRERPISGKGASRLDAVRRRIVSAAPPGQYGHTQPDEAERCRRSRQRSFV